MDRPEWDPVVVLDQTERLSGPVPAIAVSFNPRDQAMSPLWLAPSPAALTTVPTGHGLEIPMAFWSATRATGTSHGSIASIPMGAWCGPDLTPNLECQDTRRCERQQVRHTVNSMRSYSSSCQRSINLTRAFSWVHHNRSLRPQGVRLIAQGFILSPLRAKLSEWLAGRRTWRAENQRAWW